MLIDIFVKGIIIGLSASMPLGPVAMLAIQRTLNRGQKHGLVTGLGGTASDIVYSVITLFFLNFVIDIIELHRFEIQIIGSIVILFFGIWIFRSNPMAQPLPHEKPVEHSLFVLIALFSHLNFVSAETPVYGLIVGLAAIFAGSFSWWLLLTFFVSRFRNRFNIRGLKLINRITGSVIMSLGIFGTLLTVFK